MLVGKYSWLTWRLAAAAILALISACASDSAREPTLDELARNSEFQQCLLDSGIQPRQVTECVGSNPDDESARACLQAHLGEKTGPRSNALYRCYHLQPQMQTQANPPPGNLNCYRGMMGVTCQ
jgi:hypothetical protein